MEICKNKTSGKYFIYIENTGNDEALLVTPEGKIKSVKLRLFDGTKEEDEDYLLSHGLINEAQIERHRQYIKDRHDDVIEWYQELPSYHKKRFLEFLKKEVGEEADEWLKP